MAKRMKTNSQNKFFLEEKYPKNKSGPRLKCLKSSYVLVKKKKSWSVLARRFESLPSSHQLTAIKSSSYKAIINMMQIPSSKPKFWQANVTTGSVCKLSLCIKSGSLTKTNKTIILLKIPVCHSQTWQRTLQMMTHLSAPFNNMQTLKFKAQPTNPFFATVNQMLGGSSQLLTTAKCALIKSLSTVQTMKQCSAVVGDWEESPNI